MCDEFISTTVWNIFIYYNALYSIAKKCFDIWGILQMATARSVESRNNSFSISHIISCRSKLLPLGFLK